MDFRISTKEKSALLILLMLIFISTYAIYPYRAPGSFAQPSEGPFQMIIEENSGKDTRSIPAMDEVRYLEMAHAIADGNLNTTTWNGALGYPILLIPFLSSIHAFLIPDLLLFVGTTYFTFRLATKLTNQKSLGYIVVIALIFFTGFLYYSVEPQKQHINEFAFMLVALILFDEPRKIKKINILIIGITLGWVFWSNYVDLIYFIPIVAIFILHRPFKAKVWLFPSLILIFSLFALQDHVFGNPFQIGTIYQTSFVNAFSDKTTPTNQNLDPGEGIMSLKPTIITKRAYCMLFNPHYCLPTPSGNSQIDESNASVVVGKRAIIFGSTWFFIFAPYGFLRLLQKFAGYEKRFLISILVCFIVGAGFWTSIYIWHGGGGSFWRYHMVWYPIITIFSVYGGFDIYKKIFSTRNRMYGKDTEN